MSLETVALGAPLKKIERNRRIVMAAIAIVICLALDAFLGWQSRKPISSAQKDFVAFYAAGHFVAQHNGIGLFTRSVYVNCPFTHAPYEALLFVPFAHLPSYSAAAWLWCLCNIAIANLCVFLLFPQLPTLAARPGLAVFAVGIFMPVLVAEFNGQDSLLTLLLFVLCFKALMRDRLWIAGCVLACACLRPPMVLPMFLLIAATCRRRWAFISGFALTGFGLLLLSIATVGWKGIVEYQRFMRTYAAGPEAFHVYDMPNLRGLITGLLEGHASKSVVLIATVLASIAVIAVSIILARHSGQGEPLQFALFITATILVAYHEYAYDLVVLVIPMLIVWDRSVWLSRKADRRPWLGFAAPVLIIGSVICSIKPPIYTWAIVLFFALLCTEVLRSRSVVLPSHEVLQASA